VFVDAGGGATDETFCWFISCIFCVFGFWILVALMMGPFAGFLLHFLWIDGVFVDAGDGANVVPLCWNISCIFCG